MCFYFFLTTDICVYAHLFHYHQVALVHGALGDDNPAGADEAEQVRVAGMLRAYDSALAQHIRAAEERDQMEAVAQANAELGVGNEDGTGNDGGDGHDADGKPKKERSARQYGPGRYKVARNKSAVWCVQCYMPRLFSLTR